MIGENLGGQRAHLFPFCPFPLCRHASGKFLCLRSSFFFPFKINLKATALAISNIPGTLPRRLRSLHSTARWTSLFGSPPGYACLDLYQAQKLWPQTWELHFFPSLSWWWPALHLPPAGHPAHLQEGFLLYSSFHVFCFPLLDERKYIAAHTTCAKMISAYTSLLDYGLLWDNDFAFCVFRVLPTKVHLVKAMVFLCMDMKVGP